MTDFLEIKIILKEKINKSFMLVDASVSKLKEYLVEEDYTPNELEPYDALADRFIRSVEVFIKYFKAYEYHKFADKSDTLRDTLNVMEKLELISNTPIWMNMRDVRNRIVHDYLPKQTKQMFDAIMNEFFQELKFSKSQIDNLESIL